eukprot:Gb_39462 [translate_table: standard]
MLSRNNQTILLDHGKVSPYYPWRVYAWELPGVARNAWNSEPGSSIVIGNSCIWGKFIFLATGRLGDCMEMLLECLRNPGYRLGIVMGLQLVCGSWKENLARVWWPSVNNMRVTVL